MTDPDTALTLTLTHPTAARPLLGLTVLVVEDSLFACDALRLLCLRSGARTRRADCIASAHRHLQVYRPSVIIVDLGLPDGSGLDLIQELAQASPRVPVVLGTSGDSFAEDVAIAAGADGFLAKPVTNLAAFQAAVLAQLPDRLRPGGIRLVQDVEVDPDPLALREDLSHAAELVIPGMSRAQARYLGQFLSSVAQSVGDTALHMAADALSEAVRADAPLDAALHRLSRMLDERLAERIAI